MTWAGVLLAAGIEELAPELVELLKSIIIDWRQERDNRIAAMARSAVAAIPDDWGASFGTNETERHMMRVMSLQRTAEDAGVQLRANANAIILAVEMELKQKA